MKSGRALSTHANERYVFDVGCFNLSSVLPPLCKDSASPDQDYDRGCSKGAAVVHPHPGDRHANTGVKCGETAVRFKIHAIMTTFGTSRRASANFPQKQRSKQIPK